MHLVPKMLLRVDLFVVCILWLGFCKPSIVTATQTEILNPCGKKTLDGLEGHIVSPSIVVVNNNETTITYPNHTSCMWVIKHLPGTTITISFSLFDIEESFEQCDQPPCCRDSWLLLKNQTMALSKTPSSLQSRAQALPISRLPLCGKNRRLPPIEISSSVVIIFHTGNTVSGGKGFALDYIISKPSKSKCDQGLHQCANRKCILPLWLCNGWDECGDNSDELNCPSGTALTKTPCSNSNHQNHRGNKCDGIKDCLYGEDEKACSCPGYHQCKSGSCYNSSLRCNGFRDCADGSDEESCDPDLCSPQRGGYLCENQRCIAASMRCDGIHDCGDLTDEDGCMNMSIITAVILGSLLCGLLLVVAAGCGLRLYHLRLALEHHWAAEREELHSNSTDVDALGRRRPIMGRLPPPTYSQAMGCPSPYPLPAIPTRSTNVTSLRDSNRNRRHSSRRSRRPAPLPPPSPVPENPAPAVSVEIESQAACEDANLLRRIWHRWRKSVPTQQRVQEADLNDSTSIMLESSSIATSESPVEISASVPVLLQPSPALLDGNAVTFLQSSEVDTMPLIETGTE